MTADRGNQGRPPVRFFHFAAAGMLYTPGPFTSSARGPRRLVVEKKEQGIDVAYVAHLARLRLTPEETALFRRQLDHVLDHMQQLRELDVTGVEPTAHAVDVEGRLRPDEPRAGLDRDAVLANGPSVRQDLFIVPRIIE